MQLAITGLLTDHFHLVRGRSVGLVTNHTGVDERLESAIDLLARSGVKIKALFGPEHGVRGALQAGVKVEDGIDASTGIPVYSLYKGQLAPTAVQLEGIDVLICDLQDIGCRFWTYANTMAYGMAVAGELGIDYFVLDRPNPLGGERVEGNLVREGFFSFVGGYPLPIRHGFTLGELARYLNETERMNARLQVIPMEGWRRAQYFEETGLSWVPPAPNMPTVDTAVVYPGTCLFEGTNFSEGRGTTKPFEWIGAPWLDGSAWAQTLNALELPGVRFRPVHFTPAFGKHAHAPCQGVQVHVTDRQIFSPVRAALYMLQTARAQNPESFGWREAKDNRFPFDLLAGNGELRASLDEGVEPEEIMSGWKEELEEFLKVRQGFFSYS